MTRANLSDRHRRLLSHIQQLIRENEPFDVNRASERMIRTVGLINLALREMERAGVIAIEMRKIDSANWRRITLVETGRATPWPGERPGSTDVIEKATRENYIAWRGRAGWSHAQVASAARALVSASFGDYALNRFAAGYAMSYQGVKELRRFMARFPDPAPYHEWRGEMAREMARIAHASHDKMIARLEDLDQQRARRRQELLARERAAFDRTRRQQEDEFRLDRATIAALSGGTMTGGVRI